MTTTTTFHASPDEIRAMLVEVVAQMHPPQSGTTAPRHAYTPAEVAALIGYKSAATVLRFIREDQTTRTGKHIRLRARELTKGDYRILPADLDFFLNQF